jgi:pimeloyl-ACP methyl ester carboxylesterase
VESLLRLLLFLGTAYAALTLTVYLLQDRIIFYPREIWQEPHGGHVQPVSLPRADVTLHGWIVNADSEGPLLVYFGGNAEELSYLVDVFAKLNATTLLINYRGYGLSEGTPTASALIDDARAVVGDLAGRYRADRPLLLFGRSLGSGIAASVAASVPVDGIILMSPFRSLNHLADRIMPWLPTRWLLRHRIDVVAMLDSLPDKTLVLYSPQDRIVPAKETQALLGLFPNAPQIVQFGGGHNVPLTRHEIWQAVKAFVGETR